MLHYETYLSLPSLLVLNFISCPERTPDYSFYGTSCELAYYYYYYYPHCALHIGLVPNYQCSSGHLHLCYFNVLIFLYLIKHLYVFIFVRIKKMSSPPHGLTPSSSVAPSLPAAPRPPPYCP